MTNCDSPFSLSSPNVSPRKPVQYQCNNTSSARVVDRKQSNFKTPFPLDKPPSYTCVPTKSSRDSPSKKPRCQHAPPPIPTPALKFPAGSVFIRVPHKHRAIPVKTLPKLGEGLVPTKHGKTCHDCEKYEADKAKPIEKLIADTRKDAHLCADCECHAEAKEAHNRKAKGHLKSQEDKVKKLMEPPEDVCCTQDCVGKRVYNKHAATSLKQQQQQQQQRVPTAVRLMEWPWYWSRYFPTAASRVAKRIIQAQVDAENAKLHPQPVAEFDACFLPPTPKPKCTKKPTERTTRRTEWSRGDQP